MLYVYFNIIRDIIFTMHIVALRWTNMFLDYMSTNNHHFKWVLQFWALPSSLHPGKRLNLVRRLKLKHRFSCRTAIPKSLHPAWTPLNTITLKIDGYSLMKKKLYKTHFTVHHGIFTIIQHNNILSAQWEIYIHITHIIVHITITNVSPTFMFMGFCSKSYLYLVKNKNLTSIY